jgi:photosystem II stability/assembly factor-like uncharacterized protein
MTEDMLPRTARRWRLIAATVLLLSLVAACRESPPPKPPPRGNRPAVPDRPQLLQYQQSRTALSLNKGFFLNDRTGWVVGHNGAIVHTADGGANWQPQPSGANENLIDVFFIDQSRGWAISVSRLLATTDGGRSWRDIWDTSTIQLYEGNAPGAAVEFQALLSAISFANATKGWALALGWDPATSRYSIPLALVTNDGGKSWDWVELDQTYEIIRAVDPKTCIAAGKGGHIAQTTDGGKSWERRSSLTDDDLTAVGFASPQQGWAVGRRGTIIASGDGGRTWSLAYRAAVGNQPVELRDIRFVDAQRGTAAGYADRSQGDKRAYLLTLVATSDGGRSWRQQEVSGVSFAINSLSVVTSEAAWAVGGAGQILRFRAAE